MTNITQQLSDRELAILKPLNTPRKIQDFLNHIPMNFEPEGDTCLSPQMVLQQNRAHCIEGAMLAAVALRLLGQKPLLLDLTATKNDFDHVVTLFRQHGCWGALSKTNHAVLRYREPIYKTIRELAFSYFHEYFTNRDGKKTLRWYAGPIDLSQFDHKRWMTAEKDVWYISNHLAKVKHVPFLTRAQIATLRRADPVEIKYGEIVEWEK